MTIGSSYGFLNALNLRGKICNASPCKLYLYHYMYVQCTLYNIKYIYFLGEKRILQRGAW